ncbi:putative gustatory receptor 28a [Malaya genurostris]|uniref:putative gustatory receptor 28a n=1 Tax=Malaya genurostris TaxID=325434 RepID=UPI0026F395E8|nr:putative gustatory receptor 28a [Malaya genurostris]
MANNLRMIPIIWKFPKNNIFECMVLHYFFLKFNGYACFTIVGAIETGKTRTTIFDRGVFLFFLLLASLLLVSSVWFVEDETNMSPLMVVGSKMMWIMCYCSTLFGIVWNFINRDKVWSLYTRVYNVDQLLLSLGANMHYTRTYLAMIAFSVTDFIFLSVLITGHFWGMELKWLAFLTFGYSNVSLTMLTTIYCIAGSLITFRLAKLNSLLKNNMLSTDTYKITQVAERDSIRMVQKYMQIYDQLCDLTDIVNFCYSGQIMIAIAGSFVYLLFFSFGMILYINRNDPLLHFPPSMLLWCVFYMCIILFIVFNGSFLRKEGKYTSNLIDQAIISTNNSDLTEMLRLFLMQLGHRSPALTCGLFPFDWTLVYSMMATSTTYLLILIQFETSR